MDGMKLDMAGRQSEERRIVSRDMFGKRFTRHKIFSHWKIINTNILPRMATLRSLPPSRGRKIRSERHNI